MSAGPQVLDGQVAKVATRLLWRHAHGEAWIEVCEDGTVLVDGKVVRDTLPATREPLISSGANGPSL